MFLLNIEILIGKLFRRIKQHISKILMHLKRELFSNCCIFYIFWIWSRINDKESDTQHKNLKKSYIFSKGDPYLIFYRKFRAK